MLALDVNVVVEIVRDDPEHESTRSWLRDVLVSGERVGLSEAVLTGTLRVLTHPRFFDPPAEPADAVAALDSVLALPGVVVLTPLPGHWEVLRTLVLEADAGGNLVADAGHAAVALQHGATFVTRDRDFDRFPGLVCRTPG